jgi:hypothetical protein
MREHKSIQSKLNKRTEAPVNFAFTTDYDHISVAKCKFCKAWLFWPETTQKELQWCCGQGAQIYRTYQSISPGPAQCASLCETPGVNSPGHRAAAHLTG